MRPKKKKRTFDIPLTRFCDVSMLLGETRLQIRRKELSARISPHEKEILSRKVGVHPELQPQDVTGKFSGERISLEGTAKKQGNVLVFQCLDSLL